MIGFKEIWLVLGKGDYVCKFLVIENVFRFLEWIFFVVFKELLLCLVGWFDVCLTVLEIEVLLFFSLYWVLFES